MRSRLPILLMGGLGVVAISLACDLPSGMMPQSTGGNTVQTAAAETVVAAMTGQVEPASPTPLLAAELPPPSTPTPPSAASPIPAVSPAPTATSLDCNRASLVRDVTVPDGSVFNPGADFTKTWRLRNEGSCTWTASHTLIFDSGDRMSGPKSQALQREVKPGETIDLSVDLEAPDSRGAYKGNWKLRSTDGSTFGIGEQGTKPIWVSIRVSESGDIVYSLVEDYCEAEWSTASGDLPCPGAAGSSEGFVVRLDEAVMEGGRQEDEPGLWTQPEAVVDGRIRGEFPAFRVEEGDVFRAVISCLDASPACDVTMRLQYREGDGSIETLAEWNEKDDGEFRKVEVDLSELAGKRVNFILTVRTRGDFADDTAFWLMPRISR